MVGPQFFKVIITVQEIDPRILKTRSQYALTFQDMTLLNDDPSTAAMKACNAVEVLDEQFQSFHQSIFLHISWFNPEFWGDEDLDQEVKETKQFVSHLATPLALAT